MTAHASRHAVRSFRAAANPPGCEARISEGRKEGDEGDADGCSVRTFIERGSGRVHAKESRCVNGDGMGHVAGGRSALGVACLLSEKSQA